MPSIYSASSQLNRRIAHLVGVALTVGAAILAGAFALGFVLIVRSVRARHRTHEPAAA